MKTGASVQNAIHRYYARHPVFYMVSREAARSWLAIIDVMVEAQSPRLRFGEAIPDLPTLSKMVREPESILQSHLEQLIHCGTLRREEDDAIACPLLEELEAKQLEREARKARLHQQQDWLTQLIANGQVPADTTLKGLTARINGKKGGRPRKQDRQQIGMMLPIHGGKNDQRENQNQKPNKTQESDLGFHLGSLGFIEEEEDNNNIYNNNINIINNSSSSSTKTEKPKTQNPTAKLSKKEILAVIQSVRKASGLSEDRLSEVKRFVMRWLTQGVSSEILTQAVENHYQRMQKNGDSPQSMGVFEKAVQTTWESLQIQSEINQDMDPWEKQGRTDYQKAYQLWANKMARGEPYTHFPSLNEFLDRYRPQTINAVA